MANKTNEQLKSILDQVHDYFEYRDRTKETLKNKHQALMELAVSLGQCQRDAINGHAVAYIDGYLAGTGHLPEERRADGNSRQSD